MMVMGPVGERGTQKLRFEKALVLVNIVNCSLPRDICPLSCSQCQEDDNEDMVLYFPFHSTFLS